MQNNSHINHSNIYKIDASKVHDARLPPLTDSSSASQDQQALTDSSQQPQSLTILEEFELWVRSGEWKKSISFGDLASVGSEEVHKLALPSEQHPITNTSNNASLTSNPYGQGNNSGHLHSNNFYQSQTVMAHSSHLPEQGSNVDHLNTFGQDNNFGQDISFGQDNNFGQDNSSVPVNDFHAESTALAPAPFTAQTDLHHNNNTATSQSLHAGPAEVQGRQCSECNSQPV
ncbi:hypothetical protein GE21DRAFT_5038 [Neurospora crassa]|uniref:Uncharacterized protein n=1 Tax=Neurospora crassa (strain ATCC 24698 / 74-OR23-1A / CBS 708.71 / DSM 1257 / FGSC 987) TaxID=367110 RepID=Q7S3I8_NEUCR|nr:hypothetical protein NCU08255 [Neurospora crassa OR74A]EAA30109.1 hypothetical protein NCU08255 [Neurospora crassa OR74A]KHE86513.1 hypothetical protein GE21DRAFT_5038 [Neurospora crassa]|eukprot:XP_959345.1 hypothetical protein NCU08255 [Neurospora crassa OR74A]